MPLDVKVGVVRLLCARAARRTKTLPRTATNTLHAMRPGDLLLVGPGGFEALVRGEERATLARLIEPVGAETRRRAKAASA